MGKADLLGASPLLPTGLAERSLRRMHIPPHAVSESDSAACKTLWSSVRRLSANPDLACWHDWQESKITVHDEEVATRQSVVEQILDRPHSGKLLEKTSHRSLGFLWSYAFRWEEPEEVVEPITLDRLNFGNLVHEILAMP